MKTEVEIGGAHGAPGRRVTIEVDRTSGTLTARVDGREVNAESIWLTDSHLLLTIDGRSHDVEIVSGASAGGSAPPSVDVYLSGHAVKVDFPDGAVGKATRRQAANAGSITSAMPGKVVAVLVEVGDEVEVGQAVVVVEAMKMENELQTSVRGHVKKIHVAAAQIVEAGTPLLEIG